MKSPRLEKDKVENNIIKDLTDLTVIGDIRNTFRLKKENKEIKKRVIWDIKNVFEDEEEENNYTPVRAGNFCSNNYIEYKSNSHRNKTQSVKNILIKLDHI